MKLTFYDLDDKTVMKVTSAAVPRKGETVSLLGQMYEVMHVRWMAEPGILEQVEILVR